MELAPYDVRLTVAFPPNTDTDGFAKEKEEMPEETRLISDTAGTWEPDKVGWIKTGDCLTEVFDVLSLGKGTLLDAKHRSVIASASNKVRREGGGGGREVRQDSAVIPDSQD